MRKTAFTIVGLAVVLLAGAFAYFRPDRAINVTTGYIAHTLCSSVFVSGLDADEVYRDALRPITTVRLLDPGIGYYVDKRRKQTFVRFLGHFEGYAVFRGETGCVIAHQGEYVPPIMDPAKNEPVTRPLPDIADAAIVETGNEKLNAALFHAFEEPDRPPYRRTKAVVVVQDGRIIAERFAPGLAIDTKLPGYSLSKAVINALVGILVRQGKLATDGPAPVAEWMDVNDPRHVISVENLLRMTSGLDLDEKRLGFDRASQILTLESDMAAAAARAELAALPGMRWAYSGPSTLILSRIVKNAVGGKPENVLQFARRELFAPLGMRTMTLEFDGAGTPVGSTFFLGSARDWARLGLLFLNDGVAGSQRILPEGWANWSTTPTVEADPGYGAGFWTNRGDSRGALARVKLGMPPDSYFAGDRRGQQIVIVPSARLVIVRLGMARDQRGIDAHTARLVTDVIAALAP